MKNATFLALAVVVVLGFSWSAEAVVPPQLEAGADTAVELTIDSPRSVREIYFEIGNLSAVTVHFDHRFQDSRLAIEIDTDSAAEAFDVVADAVGDFWVPVDSSSIAIANDTPQNRRDLEPVVVQVFPLKFADRANVDRLLRSLVEVRRLASVDAVGAVVVRDTAAKMIIIEHLIDRIDRSPGQVDFSVDVIAYSDPALRPEAPTRITVGSYREQRANGGFQVLAQGGLSVLSGRSGSLSVMVPTTDRSDRRLTLNLSPRAAQINGVARATIEVAIKTEPDGTLRASTEITQGETWLLPWPHPNRALDQVLAVTAVNIEPSRFDPADLEPYWVGTESRIAVPLP